MLSFLQGHSIGGCIGQLLMLMYRIRGVLTNENIATVYTFGAPSVFNESAHKDWLSEGHSDTGGDKGDKGKGKQQDVNGSTRALGTNLASHHVGGPSRLLATLGLRESSIRNVIMVGGWLAGCM